MQAAMVGEDAVCKPNFSGPGRVRRHRAGWALAGTTLVLGVGFVLLHTPWYIRLVLFLPAAGATTSLLQVARNTCVHHAARGTFEHEDFSATKQSAGDAAASRRVARTILRDALLVGLAVATLGAATALVR
jgi:hypothetical protein